jgi:hypothetical protein
MQMLRPRVFATMLALVAALATVMVVAAPTAAAQPAASPAALTVPISGISGVNSFAGQFTLTGFQVVNGTLNAVGTLTGTVTNLVTGATQSVTQTIQLPVASASATCHILHLELGPLDLMLLGLNVHLDRVVLDITATSGPGNLLGNLLCGIAHLLDGPASLNGIATVLNNIIARL